MVSYDLLNGALFWRRASAAGALAAMAAGSTVVVIFMVMDDLFANTPIIWGMLASLLVFVVVSLLTASPSKGRMRTWELWLTGSRADGDLTDRIPSDSSRRARCLAAAATYEWSVGILTPFDLL